MKKIAIYCRVSTDEQAKKKEGSLVSQVQRLWAKVDEKNAFAPKKWGKVLRIYKDEACSGKNTDRPQFQQMLCDIRGGKIDTVMVTELSRLSRSVTDFLNFIKELEDLGCDFICPQYDFDTTSPAGKVFMTIIMALAQFERELTAERIKNNFRARALRGLSNGGHPFLGYDKDPSDPGRPKVNPEEAAVVKEIFESYLEADNLSEVAYKLNARGILNKSWVSKRKKEKGGGPFDHGAIWRILTNLAYKGKKEINKKQKGKNQEGFKQEDRYQVVDALWEPIVGENLFDRVQEKLSKTKNARYEATYDFFLSSFLVCDECGRALFGQSAHGKNKKHFYYGHRGKTDCKVQRYNAEALEKAVKKKIFSLVQSEALKKEFEGAVKKQLEDRPKRGKALLEQKSREIGEIKKKVDAFSHMVAENPEAKGLKSILAKIRESEELLETCEKERDALEEEMLLTDHHEEVSVDFILSGIEKMTKDNFRKAKATRKRGVLGEVIKSIHIHPENALRIDFWGSENHSNDLRQNSLGTTEGVLPLLSKGLALPSSFRKHPSRSDRLEETRKALGQGMRAFVPNFAMGQKDCAGSTAIRVGARDWTQWASGQQAATECNRQL